MSVNFTVHISDEDYKALRYVSDNPDKYVDDTVTRYILEMKETLAKELIKNELSKSSVKNIPATLDGALEVANLPAAKDHIDRDVVRMERLVADPDDEIDIEPLADIPD